MQGILVFGDSIAFGRGNNSQRGWSGRLREYFESLDEYNAVYTLAIPGETSTGLLKRIEIEAQARTKVLREEDTYTIIITIGINDAKLLGSKNIPQTRPETFRKNIQEIIRIAKKYAEQIVVLGLTPVDEKLTNPYEGTWFSNQRIQEYNEVLKEISVQEQTSFLDLFAQLKKKSFLHC
ncbi:MAG: SGNH/GDSL hydrolase family protein [Candidatus Woesearchaeota archaeon]